MTCGTWPQLQLHIHADAPHPPSLAECTAANNADGAQSSCYTYRLIVMQAFASVQQVLMPRMAHLRARCPST